MKTERNIKMILLYVVIVFLGIITLFNVTRMSKCTESVQAEFVKYKRVGLGNTAIHGVYEYTYNGNIYEVKTINSVLDRDREPGKKYHVYINPEQVNICKDTYRNIDYTTIIKLVMVGILIVLQIAIVITQKELKV